MQRGGIKMELLILLSETISNNTVQSVSSSLEFDGSDFISLLVTVFGFIITYFSLKKEYNLAIIKEKNLHATNEMKETLDFSFSFLDSYMKSIVKAMEFQNNKNSENRKEFKESAKEFHDLKKKLNDMILKCGSLQSVKIWSYFEHNFSEILGEHDNNNHYVIAILTIIIAQIKYDIYGIKVSPIYIILSLFPKDMGDNKIFFINQQKFINEIVDNLHLDTFLKIDNEAIEFIK